MSYNQETDPLPLASHEISENMAILERTEDVVAVQPLGWLTLETDYYRYDRVWSKKALGFNAIEWEAVFSRQQREVLLLPRGGNRITRRLNQRRIGAGDLIIPNYTYGHHSQLVYVHGEGGYLSAAKTQAPLEMEYPDHVAFVQVLDGGYREEGRSAPGMLQYIDLGMRLRDKKDDPNGAAEHEPSARFRLDGVVIDPRSMSLVRRKVETVYLPFAQ